jgi:micrococcal nuclease
VTTRRPRRRRTASRRLDPRISLIVAIAILVITGARLLPDLFDDSPTGPSHSTAGTAMVEYTPVPGAALAEVDRVIDGDTLVIRVEGGTITVRLYGVNTPERGEACFGEATERLTELAGSHVQLLPDERDADRFGRWLRYVYTTDAVLIDEALVAEGFGLAWRDDGSRRDAIIAAEASAQADEIGCLWAS